MQPRLLQVCNVGRIVGGTAACAWTVTRALPGFAHHVAFLAPVDAETTAAFRECVISQHERITTATLIQLRPDVILLHNTPQARYPTGTSVSTIQYLHSAIPNPAVADVTVCCSHWLARELKMPEACVLWQGVVKEVRHARRNETLVVGRICTPTPRKWPAALVPFYAELAARCPDVRWEFVGCPDGLQPRLQRACRGRAVFYPAGWSQRSRLAEWDVLLYCNRALPESFGRVVAEALRAGCIPVVDRLGGFVEQLPDDCGFLCDNIKEFAVALATLSNPALRYAMSQRGVQHADRVFSLHQFARELLRRFDESAQRRESKC